MNRRDTLVVLVALGVAPLCSVAQQPRKVWRIGFLDLGTRQSTVDAGRYGALLEGLRQLGYTEGNNLAVEARFAEGKSDRLDALAAELVKRKSDAIVSSGTPASHAAQRATTTIPIIVAATGDPVRDGFAVTLSKPGGNITGMSSGAAETIQKLVELLSTLLPKLSRVAVLLNPANSGHAPQLLSIQSALQLRGKAVLPAGARNAEEIDRAFAVMARDHADAVIVFLDGFFLQQRKQIAALALTHRLPSAYGNLEYVDAGGLLAYGYDSKDNFRRAATFVDKILKGAKPGELPFELPTRFYLHVNRKTAKALGLAIPKELLFRADRVIE